MSASGPTLIVVNPLARGGRALALFRTLEDRLRTLLGECTVVVSRSLDGLRDAVATAHAAGCRRVVAVGGDGTNHAVVNALAEGGHLDMELGCLPLGTGSDWARALGVPADPRAALAWLASAVPHPCDLGLLAYAEEPGGPPRRRHFLNIASAGISGAVDARVNRRVNRGAFAFLGTTLAVLAGYRPRPIRVECDGRPFYEGKSFLLALANGRAFGRGMHLAPDALIDDGLLDVVLVKGGSRAGFFLALPTVFKGTHVSHPKLAMTRAARVVVACDEGPLPMDMDGEDGAAPRFEAGVLPGALRVLLHPDSAPLTKKDGRSVRSLRGQ